MISIDGPTMNLTFTKAKEVAEKLTVGCTDGWIYEVCQKSNQKYHIRVIDPSDGNFVVGFM